MKPLNKLIPLILLCSAIILTQCSEEYELKRSVFVPDPEMPGLPVYSEWGYNTFGVYFDRTPFVSNDVSVPAKFRVEPDNTFLTLTGAKLSATTIPEEGKLTFILPGYSPQKYNDLVTLQGISYDLQQEGSGVLLEVNGEKVLLDVMEGSLQFIRAQNLLVDTKPIEVILSGRFAFKAMIGNEPVSFTAGRFDLGVGEDNFFRY